MNRNFTNVVRFVLDECIPPIIRDTKWFMFPFFWVGYRGKKINEAMDFKKNVGRMTLDEYGEFYRSIDTISRNRMTDLNQECLDAILAAVPLGKVRILDAGCGSGYLLKQIKQRNPESELFGVDLKTPQIADHFTYMSAEVTKLPYADRFFDLVLSTHVLEHCLKLEAAISELKRVAKNELIVVTPKQRPYLYTVDEHVQFFFYPELLTDKIGLSEFTCKNLGGDWFYRANVAGSVLVE